MAVTIDGTNGITNVNGSASTPAETGTDTDTGIYYGTNTVSLATGGTQRFTIDSSGNVGIGTSSPGAKLHVLTSGTSAWAGINRGAVITDNDGSRLVFETPGATTGQRVFLLRNEGGNFSVNSMANNGGSFVNENIIVATYSGNVGIGTSSPGAKLQSTGAAATTSPTGGSSTGAGLYINNTDTAYGMQFGVGGGGAGWIQQQRSDGTNTQYNLLLQPIGGEVLIGTTTDNGAYKLQVNSQIYATNATIATSDGRLKENVAPITNALDTIGKVQAVAFDFKQDTEYNFDTARQTGFIAQDLQVALADKDYKDSIVKECGPYLGVAYEKMVPVLVAAIQELKAEFDAYKAAHP